MFDSVHKDIDTKLWKDEEVMDEFTGYKLCSNWPTTYKFLITVGYVEGCFVTKTQDGHQIRLLPASPAFGYKSLRELICRCLSNAGANAVYKVSNADVFLPLAKQLLKVSEVQD